MSDRGGHKWLKMLLLLLLAIAFLLVFSFSTSPLYHYTDFNDPNMFLIIGRGWAQGHLPYVDLWDSKGPLIFAVNALGYLIAGRPIGVFAVQCVMLWITLCFTYKTLRLALDSRRAMVFSALSLLSLGICFDGGNTVDECMLPWLSASTFFVARWAMGNGRPDRAGAAFVYGMTLGAALMTRLTSALPAAGAVLVVYLVMLGRRQWRQVLVNVAAALAGTALVALPFVLYFWRHGALGEMFYAVFSYNTEYAASSEVELTLSKLLMLGRAFINLWVLPLVLIAVWLKSRESRLRVVVWLMSWAAITLWLSRSLLFQHYAVLCYPFFTVIVLELALRQWRWGLGVFAAVTALSSMVYLGYNLRHVDGVNREHKRLYSRILRGPISRGESIVAYDTGPDIYLYNDITPGARFFTLQHYVIKRGPSVEPLIKREYAEKRPEWVLLNRAHDHLPIEPELRAGYERVDTVEMPSFLELYHRR